MNDILKDLEHAELLVLASPIYWFDVSAQTKCFIDRMYAFGKKGFSVRSIAMLLNSGAAGVYGAAEAQLKAINSYMKWDIKAIIEIPNRKEKGDIRTAQELNDVREFARNLT